MELAILFILVFILLWLAGMVIFFINMRKRFQINKIIKSEYPEIKSITSYFNLKSPLNLIKQASFDFIKMHTSFADREKTKKFISNFLEIESIMKTNNQKLISLTNQHIYLTRSYSILLNLMVLTMVIGFILFF